MKSKYLYKWLNIDMNKKAKESLGDSFCGWLCAQKSDSIATLNG